MDWISVLILEGVMASIGTRFKRLGASPQKQKLLYIGGSLLSLFLD